MQQQLPSVQVRDLAPSASFYSAITQPLGLRFVSADSSSILFGDTAEPLFRVVVAPGPYQPTRLLLSAASPAVVPAFYAAARRANPGPPPPGDFLSHPDAGTGSCARITDLEGNVMEVVYVNPPGYPPRHEGSTIRRTQSDRNEISRILDWNLDVATSSVSAPPPPPVEAAVMQELREDGGAFRYMRRSVTMSTIETPQAPPQSSGPSKGAVVGTVLGAVAAGAIVGAGITYALSRSERNRAPVHHLGPPAVMQRRATYPDPFPDHAPRYVEVERTVEKFRYPEQYPPSSRKHPPPAYVTRYSQVDGPAASRVTADDADDRTSRFKTCPRSRAPSQVDAPGRQPLMITDTEHRSAVDSHFDVDPPRLLTETEHRSRAGSKHTAKMYSEVADSRSRASRAPTKVYAEAAPARSHVSSRHSRHHDDHRSHASYRQQGRDLDDQSYVSARSEKSASTVRPIARSKAPTHYSSVTVKPAGKTSRAPTYVSAHHFPRSSAGVDIDDAGSVAPSDSISCVGASRRSKPRAHPRDLPFLEGIRERLIIE